MDACFFDMLHHRTHDDSLPIAEGIHVHFEGIFHEFVDQDRLSWSRLDRFLNESGHMFFGFDKSHGAPSKYKRWTYQDRVPDLFGDITRFLKGACDSILRLRDVQPLQQFRELFAILGELDGMRRGTQDVHARGFESGREVKRRLPAKLDDHAHRLLTVDYVQDMLERERLEIESVCSVVISRASFRITVVHDGFITHL